jgi:DNA-binding beta-propeller fold protein YncE
MIPDKIETSGNCAIEFDASEVSVQSLAPPNDLQRFEGIAFSSSGNVIAVATADTNTVYLYRRKTNGRFEDAPYCTISGPSTGLNYPHDVSFSPLGDTELLAVAQRRGAITIYEKNRANDHYGPDPVFEICGPKTKLNFSDGVAFVPPKNDYLAACNLEIGSISFYRRNFLTPVGFELEPVFELKHPSLSSPDGLAFSQCGSWLAVANHGNHSVSIFQRRKSFLFGNKLRYGPAPVTVIRDPGLSHPHSVAFTPETNHLAVTNAGANYFSVYEPELQSLECAGRNRPWFEKLSVRTTFLKKLTRAIKWKAGLKALRYIRPV